MPWQFDIPEATVQRLSAYLSVLRQVQRQGRETVSSSEIGILSNVNASQVRKDLSYFGDFGRRGLGYRVAELQQHLTRIMGLEQGRRVILVGAGNLGAALAGYPGFEPRGFSIVGIFDSNPAKVGHRLHGHEILPMDRLDELVREFQADMAIMAVPGASAQEVVDALVAAGLRCILNLAPMQVAVPPGVVVRSVDMTSQLELLSFCLTHMGVSPEGEQS